MYKPGELITFAGRSLCRIENMSYQMQGCRECDFIDEADCPECTFCTEHLDWIRHRLKLVTRLDKR